MSIQIHNAVRQMLAQHLFIKEMRAGAERRFEHERMLAERKKERASTRWERLRCRIFGHIREPLPGMPGNWRGAWPTVCRRCGKHESVLLPGVQP